MPTFFNPGGRTLGGGDIMPLPMPWPEAAPVRNAIPRKPATIEFTNCLVLHTADILPWRAGCPAPARAVNTKKSGAKNHLPEAAALVFAALGVCFFTGAEVCVSEFFAAELCAEDAPSG